MTRPSPRRPRVCLGLVAAIAILSVADGRLSASSARARHQRLDAKLRVVVDSGNEEPQRVIIRVRKGAHDELRRVLSSHGDAIVSEHESIDALTAVVHGDDLGALADREDVLSVSADAVVRPHGLLGGVLGVVDGLVTVATNVVSGLLETVGGIIDPSEMTGPAVPPRTLRDTLGVNNTQWSGRSVVVAVIDSGVEPSAEFDGRILRFYDFTGGGIVAKTPFDDYGHGTHVAGTIGGSGALSY
ncbi:MAG TPA: S8 family serine peptidase, partial [Vicinamibacterales bacterium]|nr:S8 family serine peptidase [Vicinamibacterales bacterium]